ncbi:MAG TPA: hypothetical protein VI299_22070 [Polyangiales bacterium]
MSYHIHATVTSSGIFEKSARKPSAPSTLLVTVGESQSVIDCRSDIVRIATPGAELTTKALEGALDQFTLDVPNVIIGGQRPSIWVRAVLDANENGECDPGELSGSLEAEDNELSDLALELRDEGCPGRS